MTIPEATDLDGDTLHYSLSMNNGSQLLNWMLYNSSSRILSAIAPPKSQGIHVIKVDVWDDKGGQAQISIQLRVESSAPVINNQSQSQGHIVYALTNFSLAVPNTTILDEETMQYSLTLSNGS